MTELNVCATVAGSACVAGISLSVINGWLTAFSLLISIIAGGMAIRAHYREKEDK